MAYLDSVYSKHVVHNYVDIEYLGNGDRLEEQCCRHQIGCTYWLSIGKLLLTSNMKSCMSFNWHFTFDLDPY